MSITRSRVHKWIRVCFLLWAVISTSWLTDSVRTRGVDPSMLRSSAAVSVQADASTLTFLPASSNGRPGLIFICGSGIAAEAYAPLLRPVAEAGYAVFVIKLPYRFAPFESHRLLAIKRARDVIAAHPAISHWVVSGHSLGGAIAARMVQTDPVPFSAMILIGTTHPKDDDLSSLQIPVIKIYGSNDGIAPPDRVLSNRRLLPPRTKWIEIRGGNHSQFGRYGHQVFDGAATISRGEQETLTRLAIFETLGGVTNR